MAITKEIDRFIAKDGAGKEYIVIIFQEFIDASTKDGQEVLPTIKFARLSDGRDVERIDDDTFKIYQNGEIIRRVR